MQLGMTKRQRLSEHELLATTATQYRPFHRLFGTVWGIIDAFQQLGTAGAASLPGAPRRARYLRGSDYPLAMGLGRPAIPATILIHSFWDHDQGVCRAHGGLRC